MPEQTITGAGAGIMVVKEGKVLLGLRNADPAKASSDLRGEGSWTMPGGKIHFGESFEVAATRELFEEVGLTPKRLTVFSISSEHDLTPNKHYITIGLLCDAFEGEVETREPEEIVEWRWWPLNSPPPNLFPPSRKMLENYLTKTFYHP